MVIESISELRQIESRKKKKRNTIKVKLINDNTNQDLTKWQKDLF